MRSTQNAIQLLCVVKVKLLKKYGLEKVLIPFIEGIKILRTYGLSIPVDGQEILFKGSLLFCAGETPASACLGGFKESVSAIRFCRTCLVRLEEWPLNFKDNFIYRDAETHQQHVEAVSEPNVPKRVTTFWKRRYGVNSESPLTEILDVTECLPQDAMESFPRV